MSSEPDRQLLHAIRNHLNNISLNTELVKLQTRQGQPEDAIIANLNKITEACKSCASILEQHTD